VVALAPVWSEVDSVPEIEEERTNKGYRDLLLAAALRCAHPCTQLAFTSKLLGRMAGGERESAEKNTD